MLYIILRSVLWVEVVLGLSSCGDNMCHMRGHFPYARSSSKSSSKSSDVKSWSHVGGFGGRFGVRVSRTIIILTDVREWEDAYPPTL